MSEKVSPNRAEKICGLCDKTASKYCCPRCEVFYCSLDCYKSEKHMQCSEMFYRDCVNEELTSHHADDESRRKMIDILKKMQNANVDDPQDIEDMLNGIENIEDMDSDDEETVHLHDRINGLNLDDADAIWNVLTEDEKNEFEALLNQGELRSIIPQWEPWWLYSKTEKLIQIDDDKLNEEEKEALKKCPQLKEAPILNLLTTAQPSPVIRYNIMNVLASYAFVMRYFNNELEPTEGVAYILNICANLDVNANFDDLATAVESVVQKCLQSELIETDEVSLDVMKNDTFLLVEGPSKVNKTYYCKAALSHLHSIFSDAKSTAKVSKHDKSSAKNKNNFSRKFPEHGTSHLPSLDVSKIKKCIKKLEYYLSYVDSTGMGID